MTIEKALRGRIRLALRQEFGQYHAMIVGQPAGAYTGPGRSDLYVVAFGVYVHLEIKTPTGRPTPLQLARIATVRAAWGWAWVVRSPAQAVAAVWRAYTDKCKGVNQVAGDAWDFGDLFTDPPKEDREHLQSAEIQAFLPTVPDELAVEAAVTANGQVPAGDGITIDPPVDYDLALLKSQLDRLERGQRAILARLELLVPPSEGSLLEEPEDSPPPAEPTPPKSRRRRSS